MEIEQDNAMWNTHVLLVVLWNRACVSDAFPDICNQMYLGHNLDLLGSCDIIGPLTI